MPEANVALIGYAFMGRAHSNAWRQVSRFIGTLLVSMIRLDAPPGGRLSSRPFTGEDSPCPKPTSR